MAFQHSPAPKSALGRHRQLAPTASVKVSPICLGAMNFGNAWEAMMGKCDKKTAFEMMDFFKSNGGNFIDTACNYQNEESEQWIGEWMEERGCRDEMVIATKYTTNYQLQRGWDNVIQSNYCGNGFKTMKLAVEASLKKLKTSYIDLFYVHWWEFTTSVEELMLGLNDLVRSGKVLYLGISDTPAWIVAKCNQYARDHGLRQFSVYQGRWSAAIRDMEREIVPMCIAEGMGIAPWGALGGGNFKTEEQRKNDEGRKMRPPTEADIKMSEVLEGIGKAKGFPLTSVAMAYIMQKAPYVFPICGGRKVDHLKGNIEALSLELSDEDVKKIDEASNYDAGFPLSFLSGTKDGAKGPNDNFLVRMSNSALDFPDPVKPIKPHRG